jgi:hypothetical protein
MAGAGVGVGVGAGARAVAGDRGPGVNTHTLRTHAHTLTHLTHTSHNHQQHHPRTLTTPPPQHTPHRTLPPPPLPQTAQDLAHADVEELQGVLQVPWHCRPPLSLRTAPSPHTAHTHTIDSMLSPPPPTHPAMLPISTPGGPEAVSALGHDRVRRRGRQATGPSPG